MSPGGPTFRLVLVTPEGVRAERTVESAVMQAHDGSIGILPSRAPLLCRLDVGVLRVKVGDEVSRWFVDGGFARMLHDELTVLTSEAVPVGQLDRRTVEAALAEARHLPVTDEASRWRRARAVHRARTMLSLTEPVLTD